MLLCCCSSRGCPRCARSLLTLQRTEFPPRSLSRLTRSAAFLNRLCDIKEICKSCVTAPDGRNSASNPKPACPQQVTRLRVRCGFWELQRETCGESWRGGYPAALPAPWATGLVSSPPDWTSNAHVNASVETLWQRGWFISCCLDQECAREGYVSKALSGSNLWYEINVSVRITSPACIEGLLNLRTYSS